jgi:hypothetical protein
MSFSQSLKSGSQAMRMRRHSYGYALRSTSGTSKITPRVIK